MKLYSYSFKGMALGGEVKVVAGSEATARKIALQKISDCGARLGAEETLKLEDQVDVPVTGKPFCAHYWNGDY